jgi:hypothetical protein
MEMVECRLAGSQHLGEFELESCLDVNISLEDGKNDEVAYP